LERDKIVID